MLVPIFGLIFSTGTCLLVFDLMTLGYRPLPATLARAPVVAVAAALPTRWSRLLTGWEAGLWLLAMWVFGAIITLGLLSFNLDTVRQGNATFPYLMAGVGYPGLLSVTLLFVWRFLSSLAARSRVPQAQPVQAVLAQPEPVAAI